MSADQPNDSDGNSSDEHGHFASRPSHIPARGWREIGLRVLHNFSNHNVSLLSAGVGMFALLAVFPALNVAVTLYALIASPADIISHLGQVERLLPPEAFNIFKKQLTSLASQDGAAMNITLVASILFGFWSARKGAVAMITACNVAYGEQETRPWWKVILVSSTLTIAAIVGLVVLALLAVAVPVVLSLLPMSDLLNQVLNICRWPLLALLFILALQCVYRFAPDRRDPKWRWVTVGATIATLLWITASLLFSLYVQNFGSYNKTYGAIGSVIILIMWFYISALVVVLGAEIDAEMEHQTKLDSTTGESRPMGERGAYVADTSGTADECPRH